MIGLKEVLRAQSKLVRAGSIPEAHLPGIQPGRVGLQRTESAEEWGLHLWEHEGSSYHLGRAHLVPDVRTVLCGLPSNYLFVDDKIFFKIILLLR